MKTPILYIFMRTDVISMNPGKACAQAAHAANQFQSEIEKLEKKKSLTKQEEELVELYDIWRESTAGNFGTTVVLDAENYSSKMKDIPVFLSDEPYLFGIVNDPTYPLKDGNFVHHISLDTCAFVFTEKTNAFPFNLMR